MAVSVHNPELLGAPLGLYSHVATATGARTVVVAGQVGVDGDGVLVGDRDVGAQTRRAFENVGLCLASAGATWADVVKLSTFLVSADLSTTTSARGRRPSPGCTRAATYPPSTLLIVGGLVRPELLVEIECTAVTS